MIFVDETNVREVYCTMVVEFSVPERFSLSLAATNLYNVGIALEDTRPFLMDMILYHDLTLSLGAKPLPYALDHYAVLTARYSSLVAKKNQLTVDSWHKQFLNCLKEILPKISQFNSDEVAVINPLITVYNQPAKSFCLT